MNAPAPSRLSALCDALIEAGWLAALVVTPLYFNQQSHRSFELDKAVLLHCIALVVVLAWAVKGLEAWSGAAGARASAGRLPARGRVGEALSLPLLGAALVYFAVHGAAALWSIDPALSLRGGYHRMQGLYTSAAYLVLFLSVVASLRRAEQVERLITAVVVASFAVAVYGLLQAHGLDPVTWARETRSPVRSTLGNEIFVAAYLLMAVPLTLHRLLRAARTVSQRSVSTARLAVRGAVGASLLAACAAWWISPAVAAWVSAGLVAGWLGAGAIRARPLPAHAEVAVYAVVLAAQLVCMALTESRGPFLGLLCGLGLMGLFLAQAHARPRWNAVIVAGGALVLLLLAVVNIPGSPLHALRDVPVAGRLTAVFQTTGAARVRLLIWEGVEELVADRPLRAALGHGPETMRVAFPSFYSAELGRTAERRQVPDRAHNETFDALLTRGAAGVASYFALIFTLMRLVQERLGALGTPARRAAFAACVIACPALVTLAARLADASWRLAGVTSSLGMILGLVIFVAAAGGSRAVARGADPPRPKELVLLSAALGAALLAHFAETQFGIGIVATYTTFWVLLAALAACARASAPLAARDADPAPRGRPRELLAGSLLVALLSVTVMIDFFLAERDAAARAGSFWLLTFSFAIPALVVVAGSFARDEAGADAWEWLERCGVCAFVCLCALLGAHLALRVTGFPLGPPGSVVALFPGLLLVAMAALALALRAPPGESPRIAGSLTAFACVPLALAALWGIRASLAIVEADVWFKRGRVAHERIGDRGAAIGAYRAAVSLAPEQDHYYIHLGGALAEKAASEEGRASREEMFRQAQAALLEAQGLRPLDPDHAANLARLHKIWANASDGPRERGRHLRVSLGFYDRAVDMMPDNPRLWAEMGESRALLGRREAALADFRRALDLDSEFHGAHLMLGNLHAAYGEWEEAAARYARAVELAPESTAARRALAALHARRGAPREAIAQLQALLELSPRDSAALESLMGLHLRIGDCRGASQAAQRARALSSSSEALRRVMRATAETCAEDGPERPPGPG